MELLRENEQRHCPFNYISAKLTSCDFDRLGNFIQDNFGIKMPDSKKTMLEARLQKRLRKLQITSFREYCSYLFSPEGMNKELIHMINVITTNKTDFFREPAHFDYLIDTAIPELKKNKNPHKNEIRIWSAGCSSGEEPYTICIVLTEYAEKICDARFSILATDIATTVLEKAAIAVYPMHRIEIIPYQLKKKYFLRSKDKNANLVRLKPEIRRMVRFKQVNLICDRFPFYEKQDIIFCRNVMIYFDRTTQQKLIRRFYEQLNPGGYLFLGHSETLCGMDIPFVTAAPTVYRKAGL
ncbi:MAG: protein-glutamate O-methyltransferase [Spirochaetales bacterium]|nr:protein-glutamate O-methyltransferase [Spirochaetales bacterium]